MNDPTKTPVDIEEQQKWLAGYKDETGFSWEEIGVKVGIPGGTISQFVSGKYQGNMERLAVAVFRFRQLLQSQAAINLEFPDCPPFFETSTTTRIHTMLSIAQRGRMVVIVGPPGTSKTEAVKHYKESMANVWVATMKPSTAGMVPMLQRILKALGRPGAKGTPDALADLVEAAVRNTGGLLVIDEADHLQEKSLEELRSLHDETGIGIALVGNNKLNERLGSGGKSEAFARLASRARPRLELGRPPEGDALALADAWDVEDKDARSFLVTTARRPGGLRICTRVMETASMLAQIEQGPVTLAHLKDAWADLATTGHAV